MTHPMAYRALIGTPRLSGSLAYSLLCSCYLLSASNASACVLVGIERSWEQSFAVYQHALCISMDTPYYHTAC